MKKVFLLAIMATAVIVSCNKEGKEKAENPCPVVPASLVPLVLKDSFAVKYPATIVTTWFNKDNIAFCAFFTISGMEKLVQFANDGSFVKEEIETHEDEQREDSTVTGGKSTTTGCECETHKEDD